MNAALPIARWNRFIARFTEAVDGWNRRPDLDRGASLLSDLVARDDWLPAPFALPDSRSYRQYLLHLDPRARFSVVSFVWAAGQSTPIHDHCTWGLVGMLRGREASQGFHRRQGSLVAGDTQILHPGDVAVLDPETGDIHRVSNAAETASVSIHVYGGDIGRIERHIYTIDGQRRSFVSDYSTTHVPDDWPGSLPQ